MRVKKLYVFRHGQTDWNLNRRLQGSTDIPLNLTGREQALVLKEFFAKHPVEVVLTSDLIRARETAEIALKDHGCPFVLMPELRENCLGDAEGLTLDEVDERFGANAWGDWSAFCERTEHFAFPGGESKAVHLKRALTALESYLEQTAFGRIAVSTHGGTLRRIIHHLRPDLAEPVWIGNCSLYEFAYDLGERRWIVDLNLKCEAEK